MIEFDRRQFEEYARAVFTTDSPSGCTADAIALIKSYVEELGYTTHVHNKGTLEVDVPGLDAGKTVATSAHVDTLGMMVRSVKSGGTLALTKVGGRSARRLTANTARCSRARADATAARSSRSPRRCTFTPTPRR